VEDARYNAVIVGQTGVGKSSLINYLYGTNVAKTGVGKPVTQNGFHPINFELNGLPVCLFDSWGLEVGSYTQWMNDLEQEFKQRGVDEPADKWFHSVFYCIQAGGARIQDCDIEIINKFISEKYKVSVILTKCDQVSEEVEEALKKELQNRIVGLSIISVCSEKIKTRMGISEPFGKEIVEKQAFNDFFDSLILRLPLRCKKVSTDRLKEWGIRSKNNVKDDVGFAGFSQSETEGTIKKSAQNELLEIERMVNYEVKSTFKMYGTFADKLGYPPVNKSITNQKNDSLFYQYKEDTDIEWWLIPFAVVISPIAIVWGLWSGKDNAIEEVNEYIEKCENKITIEIDKQIIGIQKMLTELKNKLIVIEKST